jgi:hypothetical protein
MGCPYSIGNRPSIQTRFMNHLSFTIDAAGNAVLTKLEGLLTYEGAEAGHEYGPEEFAEVEADLLGGNPTGLTFPTIVTFQSGDTTWEILLDGQTHTHPNLDRVAQAFVQKKVRQLGTLAAVKAFYGSLAHVDTYARNFARTLLRVDEGQEEFTDPEEWDRRRAPRTKSGKSDKGKKRRAKKESEIVDLAA